MALTFDGTASQLVLSGTAGAHVTAFPFTLFCWVRSATPLQNGFPFVLEVKAADASNGGANSIGAFLDTTKARAFSSTGSGVSAFSTDNVAAGTWYPMMVVFNAQSGAAARTVYYRTGAAVSDTSSSTVTPSQISTIAMGVRSIPADNRFKGDVACCALWNAALTLSDFQTLAGSAGGGSGGGVVPSTVQSGSLVDYWSLLTQASTQTGVNGRVLTATSTSQAGSHPITESAPPNAPTIGTTTGITSSGATINWTDNSGDETSFTVQLETPSGAGNWTNATGATNPTAANAVSFVTTGLAASTEHRPRVRATNVVGDSAWSTGSAFTTSAAPVLTSPTGAATGNTTANAGATIDAVSGSGSRIMYALPRVGGSPASSATIISTGTQLAVTTAGAKSVPLTGLTPGASHSADVVYVDATTGTSNVVTSTWTQPTAPVLSSPTNTPGSTTALIGATTTVSSGTAYFLARVGGSAASAATIIATGQTSTVTTTTPSRTVTGLTASTANNYVDIVQVSGVTTSNVVSTAAFTTAASGDTTVPVLTGSIVIGTVTSSSIQLSWPAGSDNVGVTSYEVSSNGGSGYVDAGLVLTYTFPSLTPSTSYGLRVRAKDAAGNVSTALTATQSTAAASGVGSINLSNAALYVFKRNNGAAITSSAVTFWVSDVSTGSLIGSAITGLSTNVSGVVTTAVSNASMLAGTTYRLNYEFSSGEYGCVKLPAV
jgi:hypothetical protein